MTEREDRVAIRVRLYGRVQGVWFRAWTCENARGLGLDGWVRNRTDESVEALFVGPGDAVEAMIARCEKGPPAARVERVERDPEDPADHPDPGFEQRESA